MVNKISKKGSKFLTGALVGGALGVAAGVFAKSKTGKRLTKEIKGKSEKFLKSEEIKEITEKVLSSFGELKGKKTKKKK